MGEFIDVLVEDVLDYDLIGRVVDWIRLHIFG